MRAVRICQEYRVCRSILVYLQQRCTDILPGINRQTEWEMKEEYVTYECAVKLKELEFDWKVGHSYFDVIKESAREEWDDEECQWSTVYDCNYYPKPRLDQAQKWLRGKGMFLMVDPRYYQGDAVKDVKWCFIVQPLDDISGQYRSECCGRLFDSYESALSAGIDKALELLTDNQNGK